MNNELSVLNLILEASLVVQGVMLLLLILSIASWAVIIEKRRVLKNAIESEESPQGMAGIFESGFREFGRLRQEGGLSSDQIIEGTRRSMHVSHLREMDRLESNLSFLATVSNTSPYIGLFGTVWGIMSAFYSLGNLQSATIAVVAPHISEALIATAMGLFAAIPAGIFYNRYADQVGRLEVRYGTFMEELLAIFQRNAARKEMHQGAAA